MRRGVVGVAVATGVSLVFGGVALAAHPIDGASYSAVFSPGGRGSPIVDDTMTVAANGTSFTSYALYGHYRCSNGRSGILHDDATPSSPGPPIPIKRSGKFSEHETSAGSDYGTAGMYTAAISGHFTTRKTAKATVTIGFRASNGSLSCTTGTVRFTERLRSG